MELNPEKLKNLIADAIVHRTHPPFEKVRAKYCLWIDTRTKQIGCNWAPLFHPGPEHKILWTAIRDLDEGFTAEEWDEIAQQFAPYFEREANVR